MCRPKRILWNPHLMQASCSFAQGKHPVECFMTISTWPFFIAFIGTKRPPPLQFSEIWPESTCRPLSLQPSLSSHFHACIPSSSFCGVHLFALLGALLRAESCRTLLPFSLLWMAQWSAPHCARVRFLPHCTPAKDPYTEDWYENWDSDQLTLFHANQNKIETVLHLKLIGYGFLITS